MSHIEINENLQKTKSLLPNHDKYIHDKSTNATQ